MPLYFIISVDGQGQSEIVAVFLLTYEEESLLTTVINQFKLLNKKWLDVNVILTVKVMSERNVLGKAMPHAHLQLCMFHVPRNFRREVSVEKLDISVGEKIRALEILQDIVYSKSDEQYKLHYNKLCNECLNVVISYYNKNWHNIRKEWIDGLKDKGQFHHK